MRTLMIFMLLFPGIYQGFAAGERTPAGGRSQAMGGTSVTQGDLWSLSNNQAGAAWLKGGSAGLSFQNRFLLKELMYQQVALAWAVPPGPFGMMAGRYGNGDYNEIKAGLSFARQFGKHVAAGVQLDYLRIHLSDDYGNKNLLTCEIGIQYRAGHRLCIGIQVLNPIPVKITRYPEELLPATLCAGLSYSLSETFMIAVEAEKELVQKLQFRAGAEYHFAKPLYVRIGLSTNPASFTFGFGLEYGKLTIDMASGYHQSLGFSPSGSVVYSF